LFYSLTIVGFIITKDVFLGVGLLFYSPDALFGVVAFVFLFQPKVKSLFR
jgi:hypothetical protein